MASIILYQVSLVWIPVYDRTLTFFHVRQGVDTPSYLTVISGLFSSTLPSFLEFRALCLPQMHICSWVYTPVIINRCNGIAQRGCIGFQIKALLYSCFPQTRKAVFFMSCCSGVWKNHLEQKGTFSMPLWWTSGVSQNADISVMLIGLPIISSLSAEQGSVWLAQRHSLSLSSPFSVSLSVAKPDNFLREIWSLGMHPGRMLPWRPPGSEKNGRSDFERCRSYVQLTFHQIGPYNSCRRALLWSHKQETQCQSVLIDFKICAHETASEVFHLQVYYLDCSLCDSQRPEQFLQLLMARGAQLLVFLERYSKETQLSAEAALRTSWGLWRKWDSLALQSSRSEHKSSVVMQ